jgi:hypothetical protein
VSPEGSKGNSVIAVPHSLHFQSPWNIFLGPKLFLGLLSLFFDQQSLQNIGLSADGSKGISVILVPHSLQVQLP